MSQLAFSFDIEAPPAERRAPGRQGRRTPRQMGDPYYPFDAGIARQAILDALSEAGGEWVRRRALHRATGMHPQYGGTVINALAREGLIEEVGFYFGSSHPAIEGYLGQTHNYRIAQEGADHD